MGEEVGGGCLQSSGGCKTVKSLLEELKGLQCVWTP